jgi:Icc-related predicted phosphoesterase
MKNYLCLSTSDIHGNIVHYEEIKRIVIERKISFVFFCGDLLPKKGGLWHPKNKTRTIQMQRNFIQKYFLKYLKKLSKYAYIYAIFGNDDFKSNYDLFKKINSKIFFLKNQTVRLPIPNKEIYIAGYPYVSLTPFLQKDWEKWDYYPVYAHNHKTYRVDGYTSKGGKHYPINFLNHADGLSSISEDLKQLSQYQDPKKTIYLIHEPPYNTPLDMVKKNNIYIKNNLLHVGSRAVRKFIEMYHPFLTIHGHIHETLSESGNYKWKYKSSFSITASNNFMTDSVGYILFDLPSLKFIERLAS